MPADFFTKARSLFDGSELPASEREGLRLRVIADHFCARHDHPIGDLDQIFATLRQSLSAAPLNMIADVSSRLAAHPQTDRALLEDLVSRGGETACKALQAGRAFDSKMLADLAESGPPLQAKAIAEREGLTSGIATALSRRPEPEVLATLTRNPCFHIDRSTAVWLVSRARHDRSLAAALLARAPLACDLTPLFMFADPQARAVMILEARRRDVGLVPEFRARMPSVLAGAMSAAIARRDHDALAGILARRLEVSRGDTMRFVDDKGGEALALACNVAGVPQQITAELLSWLRDRSASDPKLVPLMRLATELAPQTARRILSAIFGKLPAQRVRDTALREQADRRGITQSGIDSGRDERAPPSSAAVHRVKGGS